MIWRRLASLMVILVLLAAGAVVLVTTTEPGTAWLAGEVQSLTAGAVRLKGIRGTLRGGLQADELDIRAGTTAVHGGAVTLRVSLRNLLRGRLVFRELRAQRVEVTVMTDPAAPPEPFRMPTVAAPLPMEILDLRLAVLRIRVNASTLQLQRIHLAAGWSGTRLTVHRLGAAMAGLSVGISGATELVPDLPLDAHVAWRWREPALAGAGTITGALAKLQIEQLVAVPDAVVLSGTLSDLAREPRLSATARWDSIEADVPGLGAVRSSAGRLTLDGVVSAWQATLDSSLQGASLRPAQMHARVHGDLERLVFEQLRLNGAFGATTSRGVLDLQPDQRLRLDIIAKNVNTEAFRAGLRGQLSGRAQLDATFGGEVRLQLRELSGQLMDRPLSGAGDLAYREGAVTFSKVDLRAGPNRLRADGTIGQRLSGRFDLEAPQLQILWPDLSGSLQAHATLAGTRAQPIIDLDAAGRAMVMAGNRIERLSLRARVDRRQHANATLGAQGIELGDQQLGDLEASLLGTVKSHRLSATLAGPLLHASLASAGRWTGSALSHRLEQGTVSKEEIGAWQLVGQPDLSVAANAASIGPHCWTQLATELCVAGASWTPHRSQLSAELRDLDLQRFNRWLAEDLAVTGRADATLSLDIRGSDISGSATWQQRGTVLNYTGGDEPLATPLETVDFTATATPVQATATLLLTGAGGLRLEATGRMDGSPGVQAPLQAHVVGLLPDVSTLQPLLAADLDLADVAGHVTLDASVSGSLRRPRLTGAVRFSDGAAALPGVGVKLEAIEIALLGDGSDTLKLRGSAMAGGPVTLDGELQPLESGGPKGWLRIRGDRIDAVRLPDRYVQASPDFVLRYANTKLSVDGEILIPKAEIIVRQLPEAAASPSADAVVMDREAPASARVPGQVIGGELALNLGRDVRFKGFRLDTLLEGTVKLSQGNDGQPKGYGVVRLKEGRYGAYGKELTIERGTLGFAGPLDDPAVDVRASRRVDWEGRSVTAGIVVSGTAKRPQSRVFSNPTMSEADAISYLISGRPMQSANATDRSAIAGAALSLGAAQTSPLTQKLGSAVSLDELGVQGSTFDETQLVAGKQLGSDLYVRFAYGLFNRIGTLLARYKIGRNVSIEAASGEDQSLDLIYSVERD